MQTQLSSNSLRFSKGLTGLLLTAIFLAGLIMPILAADIPVTTTADDLTDNGACSLREAIQAANTRAAVDACPAGDGDDRVLLPAGVFTVTLAGADEDGNQSGDFDITGALQIVGLGPELTIIDGNQLDRVFHVHISATTTISGVAVVNGHAPDGLDTIDADATDGAHGGAILNQGVLLIANSELYANQAGDGGRVTGTDASEEGDGGHGGKGGAIFNTGSLHVDSSALYDNHAGDGGAYDGDSDYGGNGGHGGDGGAIFNSGSLNMTAATIQSNRTGHLGGSSALYAADGDGGHGGGVANEGVMSVTYVLVDGNQALSGGGLHNIGAATLISSTITSNSNWAEGRRVSPPGGRGSSSGAGGGIFNSGQFEMSASTVGNNYTANGGSLGSGGSHMRGGRSGPGGGIYNSKLFTITQSTVSGNWTGNGGSSTWGGNSGSGGGIANTGVLMVENTTIVNNLVGMAGYGNWGDGRDGAGGGLYNGEGKTALVRNTILASNHITSTANNCAGTLISHDYNLVQNPGDCILTGETAQTLIGVDPQILPLGDHGGPTPTNGIGFFSPVIDTGDCNDLNGAPITVDQRGMARPVGSGCDMGAVEVRPPTSFAYLPVAGR